MASHLSNWKREETADGTLRYREGFHRGKFVFSAICWLFGTAFLLPALFANVKMGMRVSGVFVFLMTGWVGYIHSFARHAFVLDKAAKRGCIELIHDRSFWPWDTQLLALQFVTQVKVEGSNVYVVEDFTPTPAELEQMPAEERELHQNGRVLTVHQRVLAQVRDPALALQMAREVAAYLQVPLKEPAEHQTATSTN
ncbi:MAG TPA: hypothetical protein VEK08_01030 [Planctomycetota bacterium]|nr:hypothetical protein [Planctomycetota bacterium]